MEQNLVVDKEQTFTHYEQSPMHHEAMQFAFYSLVIAVAVTLLIIPSWREEFSDSLWLIIYQLSLFSFLMLQMHYNRSHQLREEMCASQSALLSASSLSLMLSLSWTAWVPFLTFLMAGFFIWKKKTQIHTIFSKQIIVNAILAAEYYTVV